MNNFPRVLNAHIDEIPPGAVWVDRRSPYGNIFKLGIDGDFEQVKKLYIQYLIDNPELVADIKANLRGKDLVCHCSPAPCHAEILILIAGDPDFRLDALLQGQYTLDR